MLGETLPAGPDPVAHPEGMGGFTGAGFRHLAVAYPGDDVHGFMRFWEQGLAPSLTGAAV